MELERGRMGSGIKKHETETRIAGISKKGHKKLFVTRSKRLGSRGWTMYLDRLLGYRSLSFSLLSIQWHLYSISFRFHFRRTHLRKRDLVMKTKTWRVAQSSPAERCYVKRKRVIVNWFTGEGEAVDNVDHWQNIGNWTSDKYYPLRRLLHINRDQRIVSNVEK